MDTFVRLNNGSQLPFLGLGTWHHSSSHPDEMGEAVYYALSVGYRNVDCAYRYMNEPEVGRGIRRALDDKILDRADLFVTSKLWNTRHHPDHVPEACLRSIRDLQVDYLDMYMIHWPAPLAYHEDGNDMPTLDDGSPDYATGFGHSDTWRAMEKLVEQGLVRGIGLSNFNAEQIDALLESCSIPPAVLQVECNPRLSQEKLKSFCDSRRVTLTAYSPFGSPDLPWGRRDLPHVLIDPVIAEIGKTHGRSTAQVVLRWLFQRGIPATPKSVIKSELDDNWKVFDFSLSPQEMETMNGLNMNMRKILPIIKLKNGSTILRDGAHPTFPFGDEYKDGLMN